MLRDEVKRLNCGMVSGRGAATGWCNRPTDNHIGPPSEHIPHHTLARVTSPRLIWHTLSCYLFVTVMIPHACLWNHRTGHPRMRACGSTKQVIPSHIMDLDWINVVQALTRRAAETGLPVATILAHICTQVHRPTQPNRPFGYLAGIDVSKCM